MREESFAGGSYEVRCGRRSHSFRSGPITLFTPERRHLDAIAACLVDRDAQSFLGYGDDRIEHLTSRAPRWRKFDRRPTQYHDGGIIFAVESDERTGVVGAMFVQLDDDGVPIIGGAVREDCRSSGIGTASLGLGIHALVHHFGHSRLTGVTLTSNVRAIGLARAVGGDIVEVDVPRTLDDGRQTTEIRHELRCEDARRRCDHVELLVP